MANFSIFLNGRKVKLQFGSFYVSNAYMDSNNIIWEDGLPLVIDMECLDYENPASDLMQLALQWAGIVTCEMDIIGSAYTWLEWLKYNIQRALGSCINESERKLGVCEVKNTIERIAYIKTLEPQIKNIFNNSN